MTALTIGNRLPTANTYHVDSEHAENLFRAVSAVAINPALSALTYFFPFISTITAHSLEMRAHDPTQEAMMPPEYKKRILEEVEGLAKAAGIRKPIGAYTQLRHTFSNCGGSWSLTRPVLFIPHQHLFRPGKSLFTLETPQDALPQEIWRYTDDETRFLIAREIGHIRENSQLFRVAMKVALLCGIFILYTSPISLTAGLILLAGSFLIHLISERFFQMRMDVVGVDIAAKRLGGDRDRATKAAISCLEKQKHQNLLRRQQSRICRLYITRSGNNVLDFSHPFLTARIEKLTKFLSQNNI